jgi:O-antigen ligase
MVVEPESAMTGRRATRRRPRALSVTLVLATFVAALMGRYTLDRIGLEQLGELDLRIIVFPPLAIAVLLWRFRPDAVPRRYPWPPPLQWALVLFGYLALTVFWTPFGSRVAERLTDIVALALLTVIVSSISAPDPARARRIVLGALLASGLLYALSGLVQGETDVQGRTAAFGGGPNVYVRVVALGILASVTLAIIYRRKLLLLPVPLLGGAALLAGSRGGTIAAGATAALVVILCWRRLSWRAVAGVVMIVVLSFVTAMTLLSTATTALLEERFVQDLEQNRYSARPELFTLAYRIYSGRPVVGGGLDAFYVQSGFGDDPTYPHNLVLEIATTGGLIGLGLLLASTVSFVRCCRPLARLSADQLAMLFAAFFIAMASMFSGDLYDTRFLWIFAILMLNRPAGAEIRPPAPQLGDRIRYGVGQTTPQVRGH